MKVKILKHCKIHGKPAAPGELHDVNDVRAKALADNEFAEPAEQKFHGSESYAEMEARVQREGRMREEPENADLSESLEALNLAPEESAAGPEPTADTTVDAEPAAESEQSAQ